MVVAVFAGASFNNLKKPTLYCLYTFHYPYGFTALIFLVAGLSKDILRPVCHFSRTDYAFSLFIVYEEMNLKKKQYVKTSAVRQHFLIIERDGE
jgi:hypothetical protein